MRRGSAFPIRATHIILTIRRRAIVTTTLFAFLFSALAAAQYLFVRHQLFSAAWSDVVESSTQVADQIVSTNGLDMEAVRNAFFPVREWYVVGMNGTIIDLEGAHPDIVGSVALPLATVFNAPRASISAFGESWRMFARKLNGGTVIVGIAGPSDFADPDAKLLANAAKFGATLADAVQVNPKKVDGIIEYAVLDQEGNLRNAWGRLPLRTTPRSLSNLLAKREVVLGGKHYILASKTAVDLTHKPLAVVLVPREVTAEHDALRSQLRFDVVVAALAWFTAVSIVLVSLIRDEIHRQRVQPSLTDARKQGEGQHVEFKRSLLWDRERSYEDDKLRLKVLKTVVAFLNSGGGALFIGVQDDGQPWGLADDLRCCDGSEDMFHQRLRNLVANSIGGEFSQYILTSISDDLDYTGYRVCFVGVDKARHAAFLKSGSHSYFYIRSGPETLELDMQKAYRHIREARLQL
jgi:hypothetical protein